MKKILFVSTNDWIPWGGSEELWYKTALLLKRQGFDIYVSVKYWEDIPTHIALLREAGCRIHYRTAPKPTPFYIRRLNRLLGKDKGMFSLLDEIRPDLVLINQGSLSGGLDWGEACFDRGMIYAFIVQLVTELIVWEDKFVDQIHKVFSNARVNFFVCNQNIEQYTSITAYELNNALIVRNPSKGNTTITYPTNDNSFNVAFVASLNSFHKGHDLLFEVLKSEKWKQRNLQINLYGNGPSEGILKRLKERYDLTKISFKGFENDVSKIYKLNQAFILCSRMEGQSLALIEAMFCGRVPIVTNFGGANELIVDGLNGFIAKSPNVYEIDIALERAWEKRNEWREMGEKAAYKVREVIKGDSMEIFANKIKGILNVG